MFRRTSAFATTIAAAALTLGSIVAAPAALAAPAVTDATATDSTAISATDSTDTTDSPSIQGEVQGFQTYAAMVDTFSCDYYNLPWCHGKKR